MTALDPTPETNGFPEGYFIIRSVASNRLLDVAQDSIEDGAGIVLYPETETALVESQSDSACSYSHIYSTVVGRRNPNSNNQVRPFPFMKVD